MNTEEHQKWSEFDRSLKVGDNVQARWTNSGYCMTAPAQVSKLNIKSLRVTLYMEHKAPHGDYPAGTELVIPRMLNPLWSANNCVVPIVVL